MIDVMKMIHSIDGHVDTHNTITKSCHYYTVIHVATYNAMAHTCVIHVLYRYPAKQSVSDFAHRTSKGELSFIQTLMAPTPP